MQLSITQMQTSAIHGLRKAQANADVSMQKLSTGKRINSSGDATGDLTKLSRLASQVSSVRASIRNVSESLSMITTADAALSEVADMLDVLRTIAVESSNGSLSSTERSAYATESVSLINEIESIATSTSFNQRSLLDGTLMGISTQVGSRSDDSISLSISSSAPSSLGAYSSIGPTREALAAATSPAANTTTTAEDIILVNSSGSTTIQVGDNESAKTVAASINAVSAETSISAEAQTFALLFSTSASAETYTIAVNGTSTDSFSISSSSVSDAISKINLISSTTGVSATTTTSNQVLLHDIDGDDITLENTSANTNLDVQSVKYDGTTTQGNAISLAAADGNDATRVIGTLRVTSDKSFAITQSGTSGLGYTTSETPSLSALSSISMESSNEASLAIAIVDGAISQVASIRGDLGAIENRLGFIDSYLTSQASSKISAISQIEDADIALESAKLARAMVMQEINTALLAQANAGTTLLSKILTDAA